jgi:hypothetical protein
MTHERFIQTVRDIVVQGIADEMEQKRLLSAKLTYGSGQAGRRGICFYGVWQHAGMADFLEICAIGEESPLQLAGTTIHELAHCLAGASAGHGPQWKFAAERLGLVRALAAGQSYCEEDFAPSFWESIRGITSPTDGVPVFSAGVSARAPACPLGHGTRGGKTRGAGSGSRLRLFVCNCRPPVRVRVARDEGSFFALCMVCGFAFKRVGCGSVALPSHRGATGNEMPHPMSQPVVDL